jgi:hypothetical protein
VAAAVSVLKTLLGWVLALSCRVFVAAAFFDGIVL